MEKVVIIGGGIAGLTCAYRLAQKGVRPVLFERELFLGGRLLYSAVIAGARIQPNSHNLITELDLEEVKVPLHLSDMGAIMPDGSLMKMEQAPEFMKNLSKQEQEYWQKLMLDLQTYIPCFNVKNPVSPELQKLRDVSFAEYVKDCPETLKVFLSFEFNLRGAYDWDQVAADYGLHCLAPFTVLFSEEVYSFEENMIILANVLSQRIQNHGAKILTDTEVKEIKKAKNGFDIIYQPRRKESQEIVKSENIVLAVPLEQVKKIFPELNLESNIVYTKNKCFFVRGDMKFKRKALFGAPHNPANVSLFVATVPEEHRVYPLDMGKEVAFDQIYNDYEIVEEKEIPYSYPVIPPKTRTPELKTSIKGVYLCGDFYNYSCHDASVGSAEIVAEMLNNEAIK